MAKQQQQEQRPGVMDTLLPQPLSPEARKAAQARLAQQQEERRAELLAMEQARQAREQANREAALESARFVVLADARREAFERGEISPAQAASIPSLAEIYQQIHEQEVKQQAETKAAITASPYAMQPYRLPPGSKFLAESKEALINGTPGKQS